MDGLWLVLGEMVDMLARSVEVWSRGSGVSVKGPGVTEDVGWMEDV